MFALLGRSWSIFVLVLLIILFNTLRDVSHDYDPFVIQLHDVLTDFAARGQATIELFPPLSTTFSALLDGPFLRTVACYVVWPFVGVTFLQLLPKQMIILESKSLMSTLVYVIFASTARCFRSVEHENCFSLLNEVADAVLTLSLVTASAWEAQPRWLQILLFLGLGEALILTSYALGCNHVDAVVAYLLFSITRARLFCRKVADLRYSAITLACEGITSLAILLIVCPLSAISLSGALLPMSESAAGGNYNLRYLSPATRRAFTPFPGIQTTATQAASSFSLHHGISYTLYVPEAGFLWSDSMIWNQSLPERSQNTTSYYNRSDKNDWSIEGSHRVFFQDKFLERYLWEVQKLSQQPQKRRTTQKIHSASIIRLYDSIASRYLCVIAGERVVSEAGYFSLEDSIDELTNRIRVGTINDAKSPDCEWTVYYDSIYDHGLSFYNREHQCNLATTFRHMTDPELGASNDTTLRVLKLKLEASCTTSASKASSRVFLIESHVRGTLSGNAEMGSNKPSRGALRRGLDHLDARRRLWQFRNHHGHLQEEALGTVINAIGGKTQILDLWKPEVFICSFYMTVCLLKLLARRQPRVHIGALFVSGHLFAYYILSTKMLHSSRAAALVSLYSLTEHVVKSLVK